MAYKQKYQGVPALLKALTGGQKDMVSKMRQQGKGVAADKIEKGINAAPKKMADPIKKDPGKKKALTAAEAKKLRETSDFRRGKGRIKTTTSSSNRGEGKLASGTGEKERRVGSYGETNTRVAGSAGTRRVKDRGNTVSVVREKGASEIKSKGVAGKSPKPSAKAASRRALGIKEETVSRIKKKGVKTATLKKYNK